MTDTIIIYIFLIILVCLYVHLWLCISESQKRLDLHFRAIVGSQEGLLSLLKAVRLLDSKVDYLSNGKNNKSTNMEN